MPNWLRLFDTEGFPPRWSCGSAWYDEPGWGWMHIAADLGIWGAYTAIPLVLVLLAFRRRSDVPFRRIFWLFGAFIFACGTTHLVDATLFYWPIYRFSGVLKLATAAVSWATVIALVRVVPEALTLRTPTQLAREIASRTRELEQVNAQLRTEAVAREAAQAALAEREHQMQLALDAGGMGVWRWDLVSDAAEVDDSLLALVGIRDHEEISSGKAFFARVHPDDLPDVMKKIEHACAFRSRYESEFRVVLPDGTIRWLAGIGLPLGPDNGPATHMAGVNFDITSRKYLEHDLLAAQAEAERASEAKSRFLANMSHEIRTPLTAILGYVDLLSRRVNDATQKECVETIRRNGSFLLDIVNDVLDLSKIEAGKAEISLSRFRPDSLLADVVALMDIRAEEKGLPLRLEYVGPLCETIESDPTRLRQILVNLIGNAIKFTDEGHVTLRIELLADDERLRLDVIDTGIGIAPEQQRHLFQPFFQVDGSVTRQYGGSGLGLVISQRLAVLLGGEISVESKPRQGSTFTLTVPTGSLEGVRLVEPQSAPRAEREEAWEPPRLKGAVLVVDDRREIRFLAARFMEECGCRVMTADNGEQALEVIHQAETRGTPIPIVLMDMQMPVMDGLEATRRLRAQGYRGRIIALTAHAMRGDDEKYRLAGCDDYLTKPISRRLLIDTLARHFSELQAQRQGETAPGETKSLPAGRSTSPRRVLIVDDSHDVCKLTSMMLQWRGHEVRYACDGQSSITLARDFRPEVILLDLGLPDMSGYEALEQMKRIEELRETMFVALTGRRDLDDGRPDGSADFDHHVVKPADIDQLERLFAAPTRQADVHASGG